MRNSSFNGGLNTRIKDYLIQANESTKCVNVDITKGSLLPVKDKLITTISNPQRYGYFFEPAGTWHFASTPTDWIEFQEKLYFTDRIGLPKKVINGTEYNISIAAPIKAGTTITKQDPPAEITTIGLTPVNNSLGELVEGETYEYKLIAQEFGGNPVICSTTFKVVMTAGNNAVSITNELPAYDTVHIYRKYQGVYRYVSTNYEPLPIGSGDIGGGGSAGPGGTRPATGRDPVTDAFLDISANASLDDFTFGVSGDVEYALTYYNENDGTESPPTIIGEIKGLSKDVVLISNLDPPPDPQVTHIRLYRIGNNLTTFTLVREVSATDTNITDFFSDTQVEGSLLDTSAYGVPPEGLKYLTEYSAMLFGALQDKLYFTPIGRPSVWPALYFLDFPTEITGISKTSAGLLVHLKYQTYLVTGTGPMAFAQQLLGADQGCISHDSIAHIKGNAIWVSTDGLCVSNGGPPQVITRQKLGHVSFKPVNAVVHDEVYYLQLEDDSTFVLNYPFEAFLYFDLDVDNLIKAEDVLYGHKDGSYYELFAASTYTELTYKSPCYIGQGLSDLKTFTDLFIKSTGDITVIVYINDTQVISKSFTGANVHQLPLPSANTKSYKLSYEIKTRYEVEEIKFAESPANG